MVNEIIGSNPRNISSLQQPAGAVCKLWLGGACRYGKDCRFSHSTSHANSQPRGGIPCRFWLAGKCHYGNSCRFSHSCTNKPNSVQDMATSSQKDPNSVQDMAIISQKDEVMDEAQNTTTKHHAENEKSNEITTINKYACKLWLAGKKCNEQCGNLHSHTSGRSVNFIAQLNGHLKAITGIALPSNSSKLYSVSREQNMRIWDCYTGKCENEIKIGLDVGCMCSEGSWLFLGVLNEVKVWNTNTPFIDFNSLKCPTTTGQVNALVLSDKILFAGVQNGQVLMWKLNTTNGSFGFWKAVSSHKKAVTTLVVASGRFYSGSIDKTIKVWDVKSGQCLHTLRSHSGTVTSLVCWKDYLVSSSLDGTIKVWVATVDGRVEVTYTHNVNQGVLSFCAVHDAEANPVLMCANSDSSVCIYQLPSFKEKCRLFSLTNMSCVQMGPGGLIFTGDEKGVLKVWKWVT